MNDPEFVADASAILALLINEPFTKFDPLRLLGAAVSAVNLSEVFARLAEIGMPESDIDAAIERLRLDVIAFDEAQARSTARLRSATRHAGLSLGDRACLALGLRITRPVITADRAWAGLDLGVEVVLVR